jgi:hypothetical protein
MMIVVSFACARLLAPQMSSQEQQALPTDSGILNAAGGGAVYLKLEKKGKD